MKNIAISLALSVLGASVAMAQDGASVNATATIAEAITPVSLTVQGDMDFSTLKSPNGSVPGAVCAYTLRAGGARYAREFSDVNALANFTGSPSAPTASGCEGFSGSQPNVIVDCQIGEVVNVNISWASANATGITFRAPLDPDVFFFSGFEGASPYSQSASTALTCATPQSGTRFIRPAASLVLAENAQTGANQTVGTITVAVAYE